MDGNYADKITRQPRPGEIPVGGLPPAAGNTAPSVPLQKTATPEDFIAANRIHVKDGSHFIMPGLALHPRELDPKNESALRTKLKNAYRFDNPSFYDDPKRAAVALQLGALVPISLEAERATLMGAINQFNTKLTQNGNHAADHAATFRMPMQTMAAEMNAQGAGSDNAAGVEHARNGIGFYLLLREALTRRGYLKPMMEYVSHLDSPDQIIHELSGKLGYSSRELREAAAGGLGNVGKVLGIDDATVYDITQLGHYLAQHRFSVNAIEHWHLGRTQHPNASIAHKIDAGFTARIDRDVVQYRALAKGIYDVPDAIKTEEARIADALNLVEPVERDLLYRLGYNICYTPDRTADKIADYPGVLGLHRKIANDLREVDGNYTIYFAGQMDLKKSLRTLRHEIAHNLWPNRFSQTERAEIDKLAEADYVRLNQLRELTTTHKDELAKLVGAYQAGNTSQKAAVAASADELFAPMGLKVSEILPHLSGVEQFSWLVDEAHRRLSVEGDLYNRTGYHTPSVRFREMISRYSELQYIEHRDDAAMQALLAFTVPGMTKVFRNYYLPHLEKLNQELSGSRAPQAAQQGTAATPKAQAAEIPSATIDAGSIALNERIHGAVQALASMGIDPTGAHAHGSCSR